MDGTKQPCTKSDSFVAATKLTPDPDELAKGLEALKVIWDGQFGSRYELINDPTLGKRGRHWGPCADALGRIGDFNFFGIIGRTKDAMDASALPESANVVWVDLDSESGDSWIKDILEGDLGIPPTITISSGRGYWGFWKLDRSWSTQEIHRINRGFARLANEAGGDRSCDPTKICRIPGTWNTKYPDLRLVEVRSLDSSLRYAPAELEAALDGFLEDTSAPPTETVDKGNDKAPGFPVRPMNWKVKRPDFVAYLETGDVGNYDSRSEIEYAMVCSMVWHGFTRGQTHRFFTNNEPHRFAEFEGRSPGSGMRAINRMFNRVISEEVPKWQVPIDSNGHGPTSPLYPPLYIGDDTYLLQDAAKERPYNTLRTRDLAKIIDGQSGQVLITEATERWGCTELTVKRRLKTLIDAGAVFTTEDPYDRRSRHYHLDPEIAKDLAGTKFRMTGLNRKLTGTSLGW